jgi:paired amphipathic helix protein Sin3a
MVCKSLAVKQAADSSASFLPNPVATNLGLTDTAGPIGYFAELAAGTFPLDTRRRPKRFAAALTLHPSDHDKSPPPNPVEHFYLHLLDLVEKVFDGELEQATFEENMRFMFGTRAFVVFTLDKLCAAICKQVSHAVKRCYQPVNVCANRAFSSRRCRL